MAGRLDDVVIVEAVRTPIGRRGGALANVRADELMALVLREVVQRAGVDPVAVDDVILGCVAQIGEQGANVARLAVLEAGFPIDVPGVTLDRMCGSGQQAVHFAAQAIASGQADVVIAGGVESMSRVPMASDYPASWSPKLTERSDVEVSLNQGISADAIAERWGLSREELDRFAFESHVRAGRASQACWFGSQIVPVDVTGPDGVPVRFLKDEGIRLEPSLEKMATLKPAFTPQGTATAGNASQISDGAAALLLTSREKARQLGLRPRARLRATAVVGSDPLLMLTGPIPASRKALARAGLAIGDVDTIEINEAFASVVLAWAHELQPDMERVNPNGGAIALGHPLGATGAILMIKLLHELERQDKTVGLQTMCIGFGQATATVIERE
ncbi:MAG: thiolase family protein [Chloroflexi bacterium]|nr:thiolase family protein [Chloroflexota bacterium]